MSDEPRAGVETRQLSQVEPPVAGGRSTHRTSGARVLGGRRCPNCGELAPAHASVCPACGESLQARAAMIRCRRCGLHAPSELALCPHCGRELAPAPPRLLTWGVPSVLVALFLVLLAGQLDGRDPVSWARAGLSRVASGAGGGANRGIVVVMTPVPAGEAETSVGPGVVQVAVVNPEEDAVVAAAEPEQGEAGPAEPEAAPAEQRAAPEEAATLGEVTALPTATMPAAEEPSPETEDQQVLAAGESSAELTLPTATPTQEPLPTPTSTLTATPGPTATPTPTDTPTQTPVPMPTYQIRKGDTLIVVARRHDVLLEDLMLANDIDSQEAFTIQPGQILVIPVEGFMPPATPTPVPTSTATYTPAAPPTSTPAPAAKASLRLDAPLLRSPESGTPLSCADPASLVWGPVPFMRPTDKYVVHLGFVNGRTDDNLDIVIWVLEQPRPANMTSWDMDASLCSVAPQEFGRQWRWYVEAAEEIGGKLVPVSPPSETWTFSWN